MKTDRFLSCWAAPLVLVLSACATTPNAAHPEASPYAATAQEDAAQAALAQARADALAKGKLLLVVYGANWCHDSRALAGWLETPRFKALVEDRYALAFINAGMPQKDRAKNAALIAELGLTGIEGTPNLLIIDPQSGALLNADTAKSWRNAASRSEDDIYAELAAYQAQPGG